MTLPLNHTEDYAQLVLAQLRASRPLPAGLAERPNALHVSPYLRLVPRTYAQAARDTHRVESITRRFESDFTAEHGRGQF